MQHADPENPFLFSNHVVDASYIGSDSTLDGFTITSGEGTTLIGMVIYQAEPTVTNCTFSGNKYGGMRISFFSSPIVTDCTFSGNSGSDGAWMYNYFNSSPTVTNCTFSGNSSSGTNSCGGGMYDGYLCSPTVINSIL